MEIFAEWKKHVNEDSQERKVTLTAERVLEIFKVLFFSGTETKQILIRKFCRI